MEENKKRGNALTAILVVLLLIAVGVICYLLGSNNNNDDNKNNNTGEIQEENKQNNNDVNSETNEEESIITPVSYSPKCVEDYQGNLIVDVDETKYNNVVDYIKAQKNVKMTLTYCTDTTDTESEIEKVIDAQKTTVLNEMQNSIIHIENEGIGFGPCTPFLTIEYDRNSKQYNLEFAGLGILSSNDGNVYKIIDKSLTAPQSQEYCHYFVDNLSTTIDSIMNY